MIRKAHSLFEDLIHWRRDFHMHPELGFTERRTAEIVARELEKMGYTAAILAEAALHFLRNQPGKSL